MFVSRGTVRLSAVFTAAERLTSVHYYRKMVKCSVCLVLVIASDDRAALQSIFNRLRTLRADKIIAAGSVPCV